MSIQTVVMVIKIKIYIPQIEKIGCPDFLLWSLFFFDMIMILGRSKYRIKGTLTTHVGRIALKRLTRFGFGSTQFWRDTSLGGTKL